ncbi:MAG: hypothetical protein KUG74_17295 [Rhodobacteraceae bacterium]|nr:hypothetical protein [Paracoccaceae bacterium]
MFCTDGYEMIVEVERLFREIAKENRPDPFPASELNKRSRQEQIDFHANGWNRYAEAIEALLNLINKPNILEICTRKGVVLRVHNSVLSRELAGSKVGFSGLWIVGHKSWCIDTNRAKKWLDGAYARVEKLKTAIRIRRKASLNLEGNNIKLENLTTAILRAEQLLQTFEPFDGAALTIKQENIPSKEKLRAIYSPTPTEHILSVGRPSKRELAAQTYDKIFPNGHSGTSWKSVARRVEAECGLSLHSDTIKRALGLKN